MALTRLNFINRNGIPALETIGNSLTTTALTYDFNVHPFVNSFFQGVFVLKVSNTPTAPSTAVPVKFTIPEVNDSTVDVYNAGGTAMTTADWPGDGVFLFFFDRSANILRLLTGIV